MTSSMRVPAGVPTGGQFLTPARNEPSAVVLSEVTDQVAAVRRRAVGAAVEGLVARATVSGGVTEVERHDDVESAIRSILPNLPSSVFDEHMARIARLAEQISVVEVADEAETDAYADEAWEVGLDLDDFPSQDRDPDGPALDSRAFKSGVIEALDGRLLAETDALVAGDQAASEAARQGAPELRRTA